MVKSIKHIIVRVIIGVLIALILMYLKGGLIANVNALQVKTYSTSDNSNFASCSNCNVIDSDWNFSSGLHNVSGNLLLNVMIYSTTTNGQFLTTLTRVRIKIDNIQYTCSVNGYGAPYTLQNSGGQQSLITTYSLTCPVSFGDNGNFQHIYIQTNGNPGGISFYSPFTFTYDDGNDEVVNAIEDNTQATNDLNDSITSDESPDDSDIEGVFDFDDDSSNSPVSDLITLPITLLEAFNTGFSSSCSPFNLGTLYGHSIILPCIDMQGLLGSNLWSLIDMCFSLFLVYNIGLMCVTIYESITSLEDGFRSLYTPKHAEKEYEPKHGG